jgi:hypothetical protein
MPERSSLLIVPERELKLDECFALVQAVDDLLLEADRLPG